MNATEVPGTTDVGGTEYLSEAPGNRLGIATLIVKALPYYVLGTTDVSGLDTGPTNAGSLLHRFFTFDLGQ